MKMKRKIAALLALITLSAMLYACGENPDAGTSSALSATAQYTVTVVDPLGNPVSGVGVKFLRGGEQVGMTMANDAGVATKELDRGDYTVVLSFTDVEHSYYYEEEAAVLSATTTSLQIVASYRLGQEKKEIVANDDLYSAWQLEAGCTYVELSAADRNYFIFTPTRAGVYAFSAVGENVTLGYYGSPYFVFQESSVPVENGVFTITVDASMIGTSNTGTTQLVIGADCAADGAYYLCIQWIAEPPAQVEWETYRSTYTPGKYTLAPGLTICEFDLTADTYTLVFNEEDQYYHLNTADGPVVLVRLLSENPYAGFAFGNILLGANFGTYHYDENGTLVRKVLYNDCIQPYLGQISGTGENQKFVDGMCDDAFGVYPLTKDLETIIKNYGEFKGYWDSTSAEFVLDSVVGLNVENAWLFVCCYAQ